MMDQSPLAHIRRQIELAKSELSSYDPMTLDWHTRCLSVADRLVPWLQSHSVSLAEFLTQVMNSPADVRQAAKSLVTFLRSLPDIKTNSAVQSQIALLSESLDHEKLLLSGTGGTVVSKLIERYLINHSVDWELESNGASDYPDLFLRSDNYSALPDFKRGKNQVYGASLKGKSKRPVRVPDGLEVKTCRRNFAVDCHHAHVGLHLVVIFDRVDAAFVVTDVLVGFMRHELYRITVPATPTTTLKASFNGQHFVSIINESKLA